MSAEIVINPQGDTRKVRPLHTPEYTPPQNTIVFPDKKEYQVNWRRNFERLTEIADIIEAASLVQEEGIYNVPIDRPDIPYTIGLVFSDAHIGAYTTDHKRVQNVLELLHTIPNSFLIDAGDTFNAGVWGSLAFEDSLPAYMQAFTVEDIIREFGDKYAACVLGNHTEWIFDTGILPETVFAREMKGVIFPGMGLLHIKAGSQEYDWAIAHNYWGKSKINIHNVCVRLRENEYPEADVFTVGHEHIWGFMKEMVDGREVLYTRPGTFKTKDRYARIHGIAKRGQKGGLAVVFGTEKREFTAMPVEDAVDFVKRH